jgi:hypothetical protein
MSQTSTMRHQPPAPSPARGGGPGWGRSGRPAAHRLPCALALLAALQALTFGARAEDEAIGRLFFSPERREALDRQRSLNVQQARVMEGATLTVNGIIRRSSGKTTVWINGVPHDDHQSASDVRPIIDRRDPSRVTLNAANESPATLRVGETINRTTRERGDGLEGGTVVVRRAGTPGARSTTSPTR